MASHSFLCSHYFTGLAPLGLTHLGGSGQMSVGELLGDEVAEPLQVLAVEFHVVVAGSLQPSAKVSSFTYIIISLHYCRGFYPLAELRPREDQDKKIDLRS